jgi:2-polyprenyl-3-methyl-5-hydroxy-6-metoxy-1,4-benzoquinol methylase
MSNYLCRVSGEKIYESLDFGMQPLGNGFLLKEQFEEEYFYPMKMGFCEESRMLQLLEQPAPEKMFHENYAFYSSTSIHMKNHFLRFAQDVIQSDYLSKTNPFVVELGCNDGILLENFSKAGIKHLGIEPSKNVAAVANSKGVNTISEFFSEELANRLVAQEGEADVFMAANVMCHIPDICGVVKGIKKMLKRTGVIIFEDPYLGDIVEKTSYDQIYDEHVFLFSALSVQNLFIRYGFELIDVQPQKTHGGSMRYVLAHTGEYPISQAVNDLIQKELSQGLHLKQTFELLGERVKQSKEDLISLLVDLKSQGKRVVGYGATSKSTTILNYCQIGPEHIEYISDTTPIKQGKFTPGMHIPVRPYESFKLNPPEYAILFAWNHAEEIMQKESEFTANGGKWIMHVPKVGIF